MNERIRRAFLISLCIHVAFLIYLTFVIYKQVVYENGSANTIVSDIFPPTKPSVIKPRFRLKPSTPTERQAFGKVIKPFSVASHDDIDIDQPSPGKTTVAAVRNPIQNVMPQFEDATVSTIVEGLRDNSGAIPSGTTSGGSGGSGRGRSGAGVRYTSREIDDGKVLEYIESVESMENDDDTVEFHSDSTPQELPTVDMGESLKTLAEEIIADSGGGPIDVVFVVDTSGSMGDNIRLVAEHLNKMIDVYKASDIDYALGLVTFQVPSSRGRRHRGNRIKIWQTPLRGTKQSKDWKRYRSILQGLSTNGDEHAYDAIYEAIFKIRFRPESQKHFILTTDEPFTSATELDFDRVAAACNEFWIKVNVLGISDPKHESLAIETGGHWHQIPSLPRSQRPTQQRPGRFSPRRYSARRYATRQLRYATWAKTSEISEVTLNKMGTGKVDIRLFLDTSKSMEDKLPEFWAQLLNMTNKWDKARLDYRLGAVRFRAGRGNLNYVNAYPPPQTLDRIKSIIFLPCQGDERVLDAMVEGFRQLQFQSDAQIHIILVTDEPSLGEYSQDAVINMCLSAGVTVSVIGTIDSFQQDIATQTHGVWVPIPNGKTTNEQVW